jgi:hypothetical protein
LIYIDFAKSREENMGELKSALERAMEKTGKLGSLSAEEKKRQGEERLMPMGRALAEKYLLHGHAKILTDDIGRFPVAEKYLVNRGALSGLVESIGFDKGITAESLDRVHAGLLALAASDKDSIEKMIGEIKGLVAEFDAEQQRTLSSEAENIDRVERERLRGIGISGSAVAEINVKAGAAWRQVVEGIRTRFAERLESLKKKLAEVLVKS